MQPKKQGTSETNLHPSYPNPIIQEALCEIHFSLPEGSVWNGSLFGEFYKKIQPDFPDFEPVVQMGLELMLSQAGVDQAMLPPQQRMRYKHVNRKLVIQLSNGVLTLNVLPKYAGWTQMRKDIADVWSRALIVLKPIAITRIGLRYINRIEKTLPTEPPKTWLAPSRYLPEAIAESGPGLLSRLEIRYPGEGSQIVTVADLGRDADTGSNAIIFDIDEIVQGTLETDVNALLGGLEQLHEAVWQVFSASLTPRLESLLKGGAL